MFWRPLAAILALFLLSPSCSKTSGPTGGTTSYDNPATFFSTMEELEVEVAYEADAEPFTGNGVGGRKLWDFVGENLASLFAGRPKAVGLYVPKDLADMTEIPSPDATSYSSESILALADRYRVGRSRATKGTFFILFLDGYFEEDGAVKDNVIGVSITGTTVIAIFKPVVTAVDGGALNLVRKYVEQSTIVHEMGHALGLVNNGVPMVSSHQDAEHGRHCSNDDCGMYFQNEGASDLKEFVLKVISTGNLVIFGDECLNDTRAYRP